jgi:uncharacterized protein YndB with AHSA1/START domain
MQKNNSSVFIETTVHAAVEKVWKAWTEPAFIMKWFGSDPDGEVLKATLDVRQGGSFDVTFKDSDGTEHTCSGRYDVVQAFSKLSFTWQWKNEPGVQSFINLLLSPMGELTRMQFEHMNLAGGSKHDYTKGWQSTFLKLERLLGSQT